MLKLLQTYQKRLANLTSNNRALYLPKLSAFDMDIHDFDHNILSQSSFDIVNQLLEGEKKILLAKVIDSKDEKNNKLSGKLKQILRRAKFIEEERGTFDLHFGWPIVEGNLNNGPSIRCPLLLWPISLVKEGNNWFLVIENEVFWNKNFILAYSFYNQIKLDEEALAELLDEAPKEGIEFRTFLYNTLKNNGIHLDFNRESFENKLEYYIPYQKNNFDLLYKNGELKLKPNAILGIFPFLDSFLSPDYEHLINNYTENSTFQDFFREKSSYTGNKSSFINEIKEEQVVTPFDIDIYQENILKAVRKGKSLVVQGPPGTGKSQLIANIICDSIAQGKKVLVVCEKKVALEVIYNRLQSIGCENFIALVHDHIRERSKLFSKIENLILQLDEHKFAVNSLQALQTEREFVNVSKAIGTAANQLDEFKEAYYTVLPSGFMVAELLEYPFKYQQFNDNSLQILQKYTYETVLEFQSQYQQWKFHKLRFNDEEGIWKYRKTLHNIDSFYVFINEIPNLKFHIQQIVDKLWLKKIDIQTFIKFQSPEIEKTIDQLIEIGNIDLALVEIVLTQNKDFSTKKLDQIKKQIAQLEITENEIQNVLNLQLEKRCPQLVTEEGITLNTINEIVIKFNLANKSFFTKHQFKLFSKEYKQLLHFVTKNNISHFLETNELEKLVQLEIEKNKLLISLGLEHYYWLNFNDLKENYEQIYASFIKINTQIWPIEVWATDVENQFLPLLYYLKEVIVTYKTYLNTQNQYFTETQLIHWLENKKQLESDFEFIENYFEDLKTCDVLSYLFEEEQTTEIVNYLFSNNKENDYILESALYLWLQEAHNHYPALKYFNDFEKYKETLTLNLPQKIKLSKEVILQRLQENTFKVLEYNRLQNLVSYRELQYQVTKKRKIWPVRKLIKELSEDVFRLLPCWLASPETVSAIFESKQLFDLVIFDEASQCYAERGLPSMLRGKQTLVIGDQAQLSPTDLYAVRWEDENEQTPEAEVESLLDLCSLHLDTKLLRWHYRSNNYNLVQFSNEHFYNNKLFFNKKEISSNEFELHTLQGIWEKNYNFLEAQNLVEYLIYKKEEYSNNSLGIITFNYHQQELIKDLIDEYGIKFPNLLFIKNIENVQGNEADIILFSTTYAPDIQGKINLNFGLLNREGGEKRLNVAITRARVKMILFTSLPFESINTSHLQYEGVKLLFKYLNFVANKIQQNNNKELIYSKLPKEWNEALSMKYHLGYKFL